MCVDYSKAFDLINHELLLAKLKACDIDDSNLRLFWTHLANGKQYVSINGCSSSLLSITHRVLWGSILGLLLFLIFINDLPSVIPNYIVDIYPDDSTFSSSAHCSLGTGTLDYSE